MLGGELLIQFRGGTARSANVASRDQFAEFAQRIVGCSKVSVVGAGHHCALRPRCGRWLVERLQAALKMLARGGVNRCQPSYTFGFPFGVRGLVIGVRFGMQLRGIRGLTWRRGGCRVSDDGCGFVGGCRRVGCSGFGGRRHCFGLNGGCVCVSSSDSDRCINWLSVCDCSFDDLCCWFLSRNCSNICRWLDCHGFRFCSSRRARALVYGRRHGGHCDIGFSGGRGGLAVGCRCCCCGNFRNRFNFRLAWFFRRRNALLARWPRWWRWH